MSKDQMGVTDDWTLWWDVKKLAEPNAFILFRIMITEFVEHFPHDAAVVTIEDLQAILTEI